MNNTTSHAEYLIVGGDSLIGGSIRNYLESQGAIVASTSRRDIGAPDFLDLSLSEVRLSHYPFLKAAFLCAGYTRLADCKTLSGVTRTVNVTGTIAVARELLGRGVFVLFLSTNLVFDGKRKDYREFDPICPITEYGRQKAEAETELRATARECLDLLAIVRLTKVLAPRFPLFGEWAVKLATGRMITPFCDLTFSPLSLSLVTAVLSRIACNRKSGLFHLSAIDEITYSDAAVLLARQLGAETSLVRYGSVHQNPSLESIPQHNCLNAEHTKTRLGITLPSAKQSCEDYFRQELQFLKSSEIMAP